MLFKQLDDSEGARDLWQRALAIYEAIEDPNAARVRALLDDLDPL